MSFLNGRTLIEESPILGFLQRLLSLGANDWPSCEELNMHLESLVPTIKNGKNIPIKFVTQTARPASFESGFEQRTYLEGEVQIRQSNWHDLLNAYSWLVFPKSKAVLNAIHYRVLCADRGRGRSRLGDALTMFDEDGVLVVSSNKEIFELIANFNWKELFWSQRSILINSTKFVPFGHALCEKAMNPFIGLTGKAVFVEVNPGSLELEGDSWLNFLDGRLVNFFKNGGLSDNQDLHPLPILGIPGWFSENENARFYENRSYFRTGRRQV